MKTICVSLLLMTHSVQGAQCNATSAETPIGYALQIYSATNYLGAIYEQIVTTDAIYLSMWGGERLKLRWDSTLVWAIVYGSSGFSMALSPDSSFLIAGS